MDIDEADNQGFKFVEGVDGVYDWGNPDWGQSKTDAQGTLVIDDEDNVTVDADGLYYLQVDPAAGTYSTTLMSLGLIGSATPTGWNDPDTDFVYDATNNVLSLDINLTNGENTRLEQTMVGILNFLDSLDQTQTGMVFLILKMVTLYMKEQLGLSCNIRCLYS